MSADSITPEVVQEVRRQALARAESKVYSLNNTYLSKYQKADVEGIYGLPFGVFDYVLLGLMASAPQEGLLHAFLIAAAASLLVALCIWSVMNTKIAKLGFFFSGFVSTIVHLAFAAYLGYVGNWLGVGIALAGAVGLTSIIAPPMHLFTVLGRGMHPKYRIAKRLFGITFPFEGELGR